MALPNISGKIISGSFWMILMRWSSRLLGIASVIILARILVPEDYGLVAQAVLFSSLLELITQFGFYIAIIRNKNSSVAEYNTVWTLSVLRGLILALVVCLSATFIADFFSEPRIYPLMFVYALVIFINGLMNVGVVDFQKYMQFDKDFRLNISSRLTGFIVTMVIAIIYKSYWAFPLGSLAGAMVKVIVSYTMSAFRPRFTLSDFSNIFNFSKWFFIYESLNAFSTKLDTFLLSKFSSTEALGLYTVSNEISAMPSTEVAMPVARASLPALAQYADNLAEFRKLYTQVLVSVLFIAIPASVGISVLADYIVALALGSNWSDAAIYIKILAFLGITKVNVSCAVAALAAVGRANMLGQYSAIMFAIRLVTMTAGVLLYDAIGLAYGALIASFIGMLLIHHLQQKIQLISFSGMFKGLWRVIVSAGIMWLVLYFLCQQIAQIVPNLSVALVTIGLVLLGGLIYMLSLVSLCSIMDWPEGPEKSYFMTIKKAFAR